MGDPSPYELQQIKVPSELRRKWSEIPDANCRGLCTESCGPWYADEAEYALVVEAGGVRIADGAVCPYLTDDGRCSIYRVRPSPCRLFGSVEEMPCPYGCRPDEGRLSKEEADALYDAEGEMASPWPADVAVELLEEEYGAVPEALVDLLHAVRGPGSEHL